VKLFTLHWDIEMKKRTDSYIFTADPLSANDMQQIEIVRKTVAVSNKLARQSAKWKGEKPAIYRVTLKGRIGRNNPDAHIYRNKTTYWGRKGDYQSIKLEHAQRIDVYVQRRWDY
jgi:hypothetical protein